MMNQMDEEQKNFTKSFESCFENQTLLAKVIEQFPYPLHPYTEALLSAVPYPDPAAKRNKKRIILKGDLPSPANPPVGCRFHTRCPYAKDICAQKIPEYKEVAPEHYCMCHKVNGLF